MHDSYDNLINANIENTENNPPIGVIQPERLRRQISAQYFFNGRLTSDDPASYEGQGAIDRNLAIAQQLPHTLFGATAARNVNLTPIPELDNNPFDALPLPLQIPAPIFQEIDLSYRFNNEETTDDPRNFQDEERIARMQAYINQHPGTNLANEMIENLNQHQDRMRFI